MAVAQRTLLAPLAPGRRFSKDRDQNTVKLRTDTEYTLTLTLSTVTSIREDTSQVIVTTEADQGPTVEQGLAAVSDRDTLAWVPTTAPDDSRSAFTATWRCALPASTKGLRRGLTIRAYVEEFGWISCQMMIKVYEQWDKSAIHGAPLRLLQYDFRQDSEDTARCAAVNFHRLGGVSG